MPYPLDDTIAAVASPPGGAARGILRLSGPGVQQWIARVFQPEKRDALDAVHVPTAILGYLSLGDESACARLPCDLYLWPTDRSYTGQPVAELHTLGSRPLLETALRNLCAAGARLAQPGEFTLRAFLAGRLDLTRAEAVLGVIDAADPRELNVALAQLAGGLATPLARLRDSLLDLLAHLEAGFDFADEDLPFIAADELDDQLATAAETVERLVRQMASRAEAVGLTRVVLVGWPNTGKSSLFNALTGAASTGAAALVSDLPGTTRDYLTAELDLGGPKCLLVDTAGVEPESHASDGGIRQAAQAATSEQSRHAQVRILCVDASRPMNAWEQDQLAGDSLALVVLTKMDVVSRAPWEHHTGFLKTSGVTGEGIAELRQRIAEAVLASRSSGDVVAGTAARCRESLRHAAECLDHARQAHKTGAGEELIAAEVRMALDELGKVVGAVYTDDLLDRIFSRFCIGK